MVKSPKEQLAFFGQWLSLYKPLSEMSSMFSGLSASWHISQCYDTLVTITNFIICVWCLAIRQHRKQQPYRSQTLTLEPLSQPRNTIMGNGATDLQ